MFVVQPAEPKPLLLQAQNLLVGVTNASEAFRLMYLGLGRGRAGKSFPKLSKLPVPNFHGMHLLECAKPRNELPFCQVSGTSVFPVNILNFITLSYVVNDRLSYTTACIRQIKQESGQT